MTIKQELRLAAVGDLHVTRAQQGTLSALFRSVPDVADVLLLCGDLTDYGLPEEAQVLVRELVSTVKVPIVAVLGNHDYESGKEDEVKQILGDAGVHVLDGEACEIHGVGFAGIKGFAGGFGQCTLGSWGERAVKQFVQEAVQEALKLEAALARLRTSQRIALLHYAPVQSTIEGEPPEIYPYLGSGRLEEPLNRYQVTAAFHGHAHRGKIEGRTRAGAPVYNVALPLLLRQFPDRPPFHLVNLKATPIELPT